MAGAGLVGPEPESEPESVPHHTPWLKTMSRTAITSAPTPSTAAGAQLSQAGTAVTTTVRGSPTGPGPAGAAGGAAVAGDFARVIGSAAAASGARVGWSKAAAAGFGVSAARV